MHEPYVTLALFAVAGLIPVLIQFLSVKFGSVREEPGAKPPAR
ncbi:MAG: hypothetical protein NW200_04980 [Hyphomonadaceae bacterium]|nr:hypothetical protein [Hyphomonadaceae bacterium]